LTSVEEHNIVGGLGSAISEVTSEICPTFVRKIGIKDRYGESAETKKSIHSWINMAYLRGK